MSAELLREAAAKMRERAEAATPGPWFTDGLDVRGPGNWVDAEFVLGFDACPTRPDAEHIASWHPAVALAVASQLDDMAAVLTESAGTPLKLAMTAIANHSVAVARAYLGRDA